MTGTVQAFGLACGFVFLSLYQGVLSGSAFGTSRIPTGLLLDRRCSCFCGRGGNYENLLFGSFLGITRGQVLLLVIVSALTLVFFATVGRPLLFASVDEGVARARGVPARGLALAFLLVLGLAVAATAQITGVLLVFALLVAPAATAQLITPRIDASLLLTVVLGVLITWIGLALAYFYNYPVGFYITTVAFGVYVVVRVRAR